MNSFYTDKLNTCKKWATANHDELRALAKSKSTLETARNVIFEALPMDEAAFLCAQSSDNENMNQMVEQLIDHIRTVVLTLPPSEPVKQKPMTRQAFKEKQAIKAKEEEEKKRLAEIERQKKMEPVIEAAVVKINCMLNDMAEKSYTKGRFEITFDIMKPDDFYPRVLKQFYDAGFVGSEIYLDHDYDDCDDDVYHVVFDLSE